MTIKKAIKTLELHQKWRKGEYEPMIDVNLLSEAIYKIIKDYENRKSKKPKI